MRRPQAPEDMRARLEGRRLAAVSRRGKYLLIDLEDDDPGQEEPSGVLLMHRGMSGNVLLRRPEDPPERHLHLVLQLENGRELRVSDPRGFGELRVLSPAECQECSLRLGPEPLGPDFNPLYLEDRLAGRSAPIKMLLLNQSIVAGLGNIYTDEALWAARLHPARRAFSLQTEELARLHGAIVEVLTDAIELGGTTFSSALDLYGQPGRYGSQLKVFHRAPGPCPRCSAPLRQMRLSNRGSTFCPQCQPV